MDDEKREMLREVCVKEFGGKDGKEAMDDETKVRQLFSSFMNKKTGRIGFEEAKDYTIMTEGDKAVLHLDMWTFVCKYAWKGLFIMCFSPSIFFFFFFLFLRDSTSSSSKDCRRFLLSTLVLFLCSFFLSYDSNRTTTKTQTHRDSRITIQN